MEKYNLKEFSEPTYLIDKSILIDKTLIISDLHIGFEEALNRGGFLVPRTLFQQILDNTKELIDYVKPKRIIVNGDFKHEFGRVSSQEWKDTFKLTELLSKNSTELVFIKGNHDKILQPIAEKYDVKIKDYILLNDFYITHGDTIHRNDDFENASTIIIGHEHPCITIRDNHKFEKFKTFLVGQYENKKIIVLPSFSPVPGSDILKERLLSPYLKNNDKFIDFDAYITENKIFHFGKLRNLAKSENKY